MLAHMSRKETQAKRTVYPGEQVDIRGGKCSYGEMVALGRALEAEITRAGAGDNDDVEVVRRLIQILHPDVKPAINIVNVKYAVAIAQGVRFWREQEKERLSYKPTAEEKMAGYEALARVSGATGVASTIAEKFGVDGGPDAVFNWPYSSIFMVLMIDLERAKFQRKLQEIRENKRKREEQSRRVSRRG